MDVEGARLRGSQGKPASWGWRCWCRCRRSRSTRYCYSSASASADRFRAVRRANGGGLWRCPHARAARWSCWQASRVALNNYYDARYHKGEYAQPCRHPRGRARRRRHSLRADSGRRDYYRIEGMPGRAAGGDLAASPPSTRAVVLTTKAVLTRRQAEFSAWWVPALFRVPRRRAGALTSRRHGPLTPPACASAT
jgi:hypothetical protein